MARDAVAYEVEGWGVGELWLDGRPRRLARAAVPVEPRRRTGTALSSSSGCGRTSPAPQDVVRRRRARPRVRDAVPRAVRARAAGGAARRGRDLRRARGARRRARRGARRRLVLRARTGSGSSCRATASSAPAGIGSYGSLGVAYKRRLLELEGVPLSEDLRNELARSRPTRTATGSPSCRASSTSPAACTCAAAARSRCISISRAPRSRAARSRSCARSTSTRRSAPTSSTRSTAPTRYQLHVEGTPHASRRCTAPACSTRSHRPLERPPQRVLVARAAAARAYLRGALLGAGSLSGPRDPHLEIRTAELEGARVPRRGRCAGRR